MCGMGIGAGPSFLEELGTNCQDCGWWTLFLFSLFLLFDFCFLFVFFLFSFFYF